MCIKDDHIVFYPVGYSLKRYMIKFHKVSVVFASYDNAFLDKICFSYESINEYNVETDDNEHDILKLIAIKDDHLFSNRYDISTYNENAFIDKEHPMYINGVNNEIIDCHGVKIYKYHYPNESVHVFNQRDLSFTVLVSNDNDIVKFSKMALKQLLCECFSRKHIYSIHAMAVKRDNKAFIFYGGSRKGKSTLYANLICNGFLPINDDIVFFYDKVESVNIFSFPIPPQFRASSNNIKMSDSYYNKKDDILNNPRLFLCVENEISLSAVFEISFSYETASIISKNKPNIKKIARACISHYPVKVDEHFLNAFNSILGIPYYHLSMSSDYNEVCKKISEFYDDCF